MAGPLERRHCCLLRRGWQMGNRDSCVCVCVGECFGGMGGWLVEGGRTSQARLQSYWHAESHIWWAENSVYRHAEVGAFQRASDSGCVEGGILKTQISLPTSLARRSPASAATPVPIYLISASALLSGRRLIFAGTRERRQCHRRVRRELAKRLVWK